MSTDIGTFKTYFPDVVCSIYANMILATMWITYTRT